MWFFFSDSKSLIDIRETHWRVGTRVDVWMCTVVGRWKQERESINGNVKVGRLKGNIRWEWSAILMSPSHQPWHDRSRSSMKLTLFLIFHSHHWRTLCFSSHSCHFLLTITSAFVIPGIIQDLRRQCYEWILVRRRVVCGCAFWKAIFLPRKITMPT